MLDKHLLHQNTESDEEKEKRKRENEREEHRVRKLQESVTFCTTPHEAVKSDVCRSIFSLTSKKIENGKNDIEIRTLDSILVNEPITQSDHEKLLSFLKNTKAREIAQNYLSKLSLLENHLNADFMKEFLKDSEGKFTIEKIVDYIITLVTNHSLIINKGHDIKAVGYYFNYYKFTHSNGKVGLLKVIANSIIYLNGEFDNINILHNNGGLIICDESNNGEQPITKIFNFKGSDFELIKTFPHKTYIDHIEYSLLTFSQGGNKYGLIKTSTNDGKIEFEEIIDAKYDIIKFNDFLAIGFAKGEGNTGIIDIYCRNESGLTKLLSISCINNDFILPGEHNYKVPFLPLLAIKIINDNYIEIETEQNGKEIYFFDTTEKTLTLIQQLSGINSYDGELILGHETYISFISGERGQYIFDPKTKELKCLIKYESKNIYGEKAQIDQRGRVRIEGFDDKLIYYHNGHIYTLKWPIKSGIDKKGLYIKKTFFGKKQYIDHDTSFDQLADILEKLESPLILK